MIKRGMHILIGALAMCASPALGQSVINFTGPTSTTFAFGSSSGGTSVAVTGYTFSGAPNSLDNVNLSTLTSGALLAVSANGIGVCSESSGPSNSTVAAGSGECPQVDSNGTPNEALYLDFSGSTTTNILNAVLNIVDSDDTLGIYGVAANGTLDFLGFAGQTIASGGLGFSSTNNGGNQYTLTFNPVVSGFSNYLFTTTRDTADGYRLRSLTIAAVPELEVWAMLIFGFGAVGLQMRRRGGLRTVTA